GETRPTAGAPRWTPGTARSAPRSTPLRRAVPRYAATARPGAHSTPPPAAGAPAAALRGPPGSPPAAHGRSPRSAPPVTWPGSGSASPPKPASPAPDADG